MPPTVWWSPLSEPCLLLVIYTVFSGAGVYSQLTASKEGQEAAEEAAKLLHLVTSGYDIDRNNAKRLAFATLEAVLQTQLGVFFAANLAAGCYASFTLVTKTLFLGQLTTSETSQLSECLLKFAVLKVAFFAVVHSPGFGSVVQWLAWCAISCWFSMFTKLASLRGNALLSSPSASLAQHARILLLLGGILAQDINWVVAFLWSAHGMQGGSLSLALLWLFDAVFVAVDAFFALLKYAVQAADHYSATRAEARGEEREPWEGRTALVYSLDLAADLALASLTLGHYLHLWWLHGLQLQLIDGVLFLDVRLLVGFIQRRLRRHASYRRLQRQLCHDFEDATAQQLAESCCCICLESMKAGKLLPCGHVMHTSCLCAWVQQNATGTCPLCRASLDIQPQLQLQQLPRSWRPQLQQSLGTVSNQHRVDEVQQKASPPTKAVTRVDASSFATSCSTGSPLRPFTRLQAHLAAAAAQAASHAGSSVSGGYGPSHCHRSDGMLD